MATPQLKTYFKKFKSDHLGQIQLTGIVNIRNFDTVNLRTSGYGRGRGPKLSPVSVSGTRSKGPVYARDAALV